MDLLQTLCGYERHEIKGITQLLGSLVDTVLLNVQRVTTRVSIHVVDLHSVIVCVLCIKHLYSFWCCCFSINQSNVMCIAPQSKVFSKALRGTGEIKSH